MVERHLGEVSASSVVALVRLMRSEVRCVNADNVQLRRDGQRPGQSQSGTGNSPCRRDLSKLDSPVAKGTRVRSWGSPGVGRVFASPSSQGRTQAPTCDLSTVHCP